MARKKSTARGADKIAEEKKEKKTTQEIAPEVHQRIEVSGYIFNDYSLEEIAIETIKLM